MTAKSLYIGRVTEYQYLNSVFKEDKAIAALSYLCRLTNNKLNHYTAAKLLYLFDREVLLETGEPAFFGTYYALPKGPIISEVNNGISSCSEITPEAPYDWSPYFTLEVATHTISQKDPDAKLFEGLLSEEETDRLTTLIQKYRSAPKGVLESDIQNLPEHIDLLENERRRRMPYQFVFERNVFSNEQITELMQEIAYEIQLRTKLENRC